MKCPHCGNYIENTLWQALKPYHGLTDKVVITNIDTILEVGPQIVGIFEEKNGKLKIRNYQAVLLKKVARRLDVPVYFIERKEDDVKLYEMNPHQKLRGGYYLEKSQLIPVFHGNV